jgi:hypothetical protein
MKFAAVVLSVPKAGLSHEQNEDAAACGAHEFALCDGASEGWASGAWARHLCNACVAALPKSEGFAAWLAKARGTFSTNDAPAALAWYAEQKQAQGAFCTLLALKFNRALDGGIKYRGLAVGDTELFHRRGSTIVAYEPLRKAAEFGTRPHLVGSCDGAVEPQWFAGRAEPGDVFYLATDAVAEWFLWGLERGDEPWTSLDAVTSAVDAATEFAQWVQSLRRPKRLKNDDSTLIRLEVPAAPTSAVLPKRVQE